MNQSQWFYSEWFWFSLIFNTFYSSILVQNHCIPLIQFAVLCQKRRITTTYTPNFETEIHFSLCFGYFSIEDIDSFVISCCRLVCEMIVTFEEDFFFFSFVGLLIFNHIYHATNKQWWYLKLFREYKDKKKQKNIPITALYALYSIDVLNH